MAAPSSRKPQRRAKGSGKPPGNAGDWIPGNPVSALKPLMFLVGRWRTVIRWSEETRKLAGGPRSFQANARFEWLARGQFLMVTLRIGFPTRWIIAGDDGSTMYTLLGSDSRGVSRVYSMSLKRGIWRLWRASPGFHQRFVGTVSKDERTITGYFERSVDGRRWIRDADIVFTREGQSTSQC